MWLKNVSSLKLLIEPLWVMPDQRGLVALNQLQPLKTRGDRSFGKRSVAVNRTHKKEAERTTGPELNSKPKMNDVCTDTSTDRHAASQEQGCSSSELLSPPYHP